MPRVANPPRPNQSHGAVAAQNHSQFKFVANCNFGTFPLNYICRIPLNDDRQEKAVRFQSRQALHDLQINQIKAAASPMRKMNNHERPSSNSPRTSRSQRNLSSDIFEDSALLVGSGNPITPMKRVPILANFEEWMKMATDNKINANNSWNFALIDYFYDMSLLKEGDGVNFQKASCTLDGCVKIYTSRVDSVATETGKLLSGLADSGTKKHKQDEAGPDEGEGEGEDVDEDDVAKRRMRRRVRATSKQIRMPLTVKGNAVLRSHLSTILCTSPVQKIRA